MCESCRLQLGAEKFGQVHSLPIDELLMTHPCILHILLPHVCSAFYIWNFFFVVISTLFVVFVIGLPSSTNDPLLVHFPPKLFPRSVTCKNLSTLFGATKGDLVNLPSEGLPNFLADSHDQIDHLPCLENFQVRRERWTRVRRFVYVSCTLVIQRANCQK